MSVTSSIGGSVDPIIERAKRAIKLDPGVYAEIGNDPAGTQQSIIVVVAAALIGGLGPLIGPGDFSAGGWIASGLYAVVGVAIGTGVLFLIGRLFKAQGEYINLFRGLGFAYAPQALAIIPIVGGIVGTIWSIVLAIRAVKETQTVSDGTAAVIVLIPTAILLVLGIILAIIIGFALFGIAAANS
jgi:hypothetical protein